MYIEQLYTNCLSEAAYYIESNGEAAVIDPIRETEPYLRIAEERGATIKYILETHFHADFVSGHLDLAKKTGAKIVYGPGAKPAYDVHIAADGETLALGALNFKVLHTPGHTPESTCYLLHDESGKPHALFSGDTLFVGDVGRPDLAIKSDPPLTPELLAGMMYDSLRNKIMPLPDDVLLYPAHGPGSSCGKALGPERESVLGIQKQTNYALQPMSKEEFIHTLTEGILPPPKYFFDDARINMQGYKSIDSVMAENQKPLSPAAVEAEIEAGALVLDTRHPNDFEQGHVPGSISIGLNGSYAVWVGTLIDINQPLVVVATPGKESEAILRLARVGFENVRGVLDGSIESWRAAGKAVATVDSVSPEEFAAQQAEGVVLDVRKPDEFETSHVKGAQHVSLSSLQDRIAEIPRDQKLLVHCAGGYRSMIAASILKAHGIHNLVNVYKGFGGIKLVEGVELASGAPVGA